MAKPKKPKQPKKKADGSWVDKVTELTMTEVDLSASVTLGIREAFATSLVLQEAMRIGVENGINTFLQHTFARKGTGR